MLDRYSNMRLDKIWSETNKWRLALKYEWSVLEALNCDEKALAHCFDALIHNNLVDRVKEEEETTKHDVVAFLNVIEKHMYAVKTPFEIINLLHFGLTSSDVIDSVNETRMLMSAQMITGGIKVMCDVLKKVMRDNQGTVMIGRTHGMQGAYITLTHKLYRYYVLLEHISHVMRGQQYYFKAAGPMGGHEFIDREKENIILHLYSDKVQLPRSLCTWSAPSQIIPRELTYERLSTLGMLSSALAGIALEIRHLHRTEIEEVKESRPADSSGSSSMPHKENPIICEQICGLDRVIQGYVRMASDNTQLWHERDISHSSVERIMLPDIYGYIYHMLYSMTDIVFDMQIDKKQIKHNIAKHNTHNGHWSYYIYNILCNHGIPRDIAYDLVKHEIPNKIKHCGVLYLATQNNTTMRNVFKEYNVSMPDIQSDIKEMFEKYIPLLEDEQYIINCLGIL